MWLKYIVFLVHHEMHMYEENKVAKNNKIVIFQIYFVFLYGVVISFCKFVDSVYFLIIVIFINK
jgi:hypothetical protein